MEIVKQQSSRAAQRTAAAQQQHSSSTAQDKTTIHVSFAPLLAVTAIAAEAELS